LSIQAQQVFLIVITKDFNCFPREPLRNLLEAYNPIDQKCRHLYKECLKHFPEIKSNVEHIIIDESDRDILQMALKTRSNAFMSGKAIPQKHRLHSEMEVQQDVPKKAAKTSENVTPSAASSITVEEQPQFDLQHAPPIEATLSSEQTQMLSKLAKTLQRLSQTVSQSKGTINVELPERDLEPLKQIDNNELLDLMLQQLDMHIMSDQMTVLLCKFFMDSKIGLQQSRSFVYYILFKKVSIQMIDVDHNVARNNAAECI
jgi:hypothetical protein